MVTFTLHEPYRYYSDGDITTMEYNLNNEGCDYSVCFNYNRMLENDDQVYISGILTWKDNNSHDPQERDVSEPEFIDVCSAILDSEQNEKPDDFDKNYDLECIKNILYLNGVL